MANTSSCTPRATPARAPGTLALTCTKSSASTTTTQSELAGGGQQQHAQPVPRLAWVAQLPLPSGWPPNNLALCLQPIHWWPPSHQVLAGLPPIRNTPAPAVHGRGCISAQVGVRRVAQRQKHWCHLLASVQTRLERSCNSLYATTACIDTTIYSQRNALPPHQVPLLPRNRPGC